MKQNFIGLLIVSLFSSVALGQSLAPEAMTQEELARSVDELTRQTDERFRRDEEERFEANFLEVRVDPEVLRLTEDREAFHFFQEKAGAIWNSSPDQEFVNQYCRDFQQKVQEHNVLLPHYLENSQANQYLPGIRGRMNSPSGPIGRALVNEEDHRYFSNVTRAITREFFAEKCAGRGRDAEVLCYANLVSDENLRQDFIEICQRNMENNLLSESENIASEAYRNFDGTVLAEYSALHDHEDSNNHHITQPTCENAELCMWTKPANYNTSCNMFECTAGGESFGKGNPFELLGQYFLLDQKKFDLSGDENFCNKCFKDAADDTNNAFSRENAERDLKNALAGKQAGKELAKIADVIEAVHDFSAIRGSHSDIACTGELAGLFSNKCGENDENNNFDERLEKALSNLDFEAETADQFLEGLRQRVLPLNAENNCKREDYAIYKTNQWMSQENGSAREAFGTFFKALKKNPQLDQAVFGNGNYCAEGASPDKSFIEFYSETLTGQLMDKVASIQNSIIEEGPQGFFARVCLIDDDLLKGMFCESQSELVSPNAVEYFRKFKPRFNNVINNFRNDHYPELKNGSSTSFASQNEIEEIRGALRSMLNTQIKNTLLTGAKFNPDIKVNLDSWENLCELRERSLNDENMFISDIFEEPGSSALENFSSSKCEAIINAAKSALCEDPSLGPGEELAEARTEVLAQDSTNIYGVNSVVCSLNSSEELVNEGHPEVPNPLEMSDFERMAAFPEGLYPEQSNRNSAPLDFNRFRSDNNLSCTSAYMAAQKNLFNARIGRDTLSGSASSLETQIVLREDKERVVAINTASEEREKASVVVRGGSELRDAVSYFQSNPEAYSSGNFGGVFSGGGSYRPTAESSLGTSIGTSIESQNYLPRATGEASLDQTGQVSSQPELAPRRSIASEGAAEPATGFSDLLGSMRDNPGSSVDLPATAPYSASAPACQEASCVTQVLSEYAELAPGQKTLDARERVAQAVGAHDPEERAAVSEILNNPGDSQAVNILADLVRTKDAQISELTEKFSALQERMDNLEKNESISFTDSETGQSRTISRAEAQRRLSDRNQALVPSFSDEVGNTFQNVTDIQRERSRPSAGTDFVAGETNFGSYTANRQAIRESGAETSRLLNDSPQTQAYLTTMSTQPSTDDLAALVQRAQSEGVLGLIVHYHPVTGEPQIKDPQSDRVWNVPPEIRGMIPSSMLELDAHSFLTFAQTTGREPLESLAAAMSDLEQFVSSEQSDNTRLADLTQIFQNLNGDN